ncbi:MAG: capsule assembly Wzi family protein [Bacteroidetes bacterium]|nr:capsule assembly Wzi family protein [Bacteroidota bacterium]
MKYKYIIFSFLVFLLICSNWSFALNDSTTTYSTNLFYEIGASSGGANYTPFWLRAGNYGTIPTNSNFILGKIGGSFEDKGRKVGYKIEGELNVNFGKESQIYIPVGAVTLTYKGLEFNIGRRKEVVGLGDTLMTSGFYIWSGNALPIPKVQIGTRGFRIIPFTNGMVSWLGNFAHGWFGTGEFASSYFLHQKTLFLKFGKSQNVINFYLGATHFGQWGGYAPKLIKYNITTPNGALPGSWKDYVDMVLSKNLDVTSNSNLSLYQVGNQLGTIEALVNFKRRYGEWKTYFQHGIESRGIFNNLPDGLYGISYKNTLKSSKTLQIRKLLFEVLTTMNQNTQFDNNSELYYNDDYFNHAHQYYDGWTYKKAMIGSPFFTIREDVRAEWQNFRKSIGEDVFVSLINNRFLAFYGAIDVGLGKSVLLKVKGTKSINYLSFDTKTGGYGLRTPQFSGYLSICKMLKLARTSQIELKMAYDEGRLLPSNLGAYVLFKQTIF